MTADWHGYLPPEVPECDLMVVAGDIGLGENFSKFEPDLLLSDLVNWIRIQKVPIVVIAGNHDFHPEILRNLPWIYLEDEAREIEILRTAEKLKIWGSPWSNPFAHDWAFNMTEEDQVELFKQIPEDVDVIISHGPPHGLCDVTYGYGGDRPPLNVGSKALRARMQQLPNLKLVACGHIHSAYGQEGITVNGTLVNEKYQVTNKPYAVEI